MSLVLFLTPFIYISPSGLFCRVILGSLNTQIEELEWTQKKEQVVFPDD
jgi:hypothetical protein